jgi:Flp pilus assembly protein TadG
MWCDNSASQMVEFAVSLPLIIVIVVGIFDFSGAYTLKQKLANAAREGARAAAADPATDLGNGGTPASISDAFQVVDNYLLAEKISDCGLNPSTGSQSALTWTFSASVASPPCVINLSINRGFITKQAVTGGTLNIVGTQVTIQYAYKWHFNNVSSVILPPTLTTSSVAMNEN